MPDNTLSDACWRRAIAIALYHRWVRNTDEWHENVELSSIERVLSGFQAVALIDRALAADLGILAAFGAAFDPMRVLPHGALLAEVGAPELMRDAAFEDALMLSARGAERGKRALFDALGATHAQYGDDWPGMPKWVANCTTFCEAVDQPRHPMWRDEEDFAHWDALRPAAARDTDALLAGLLDDVTALPIEVSRWCLAVWREHSPTTAARTSPVE